MSKVQTDKSGLVFAFIAYGMWGFFPLYFYLLKFAEPIAVLSHRIVWSVCFLGLFLSIQKRWHEVIIGIRNPRVFWLLVLTALLISINWLIFTWAAANGHVIEGSLGYLICPILSVALGVFFLGETLSKAQKISLVIVAIGVGIAIVGYGRLPWVAISLAVSFALYGFFRKKTDIQSQPGLMIETLVVFVPALLYLLLINGGEFTKIDVKHDFLLIFVGLLTVLPLVALATALKKLPMKVVGMVQYLTPIMQFLCGLLVLGEPFNATQAMSFGLICLGLVIFSLPTSSRNKRTQ